MTSITTKTTSICTVLIAVLAIGITNIPQADAVTCLESTGNHCYAVGVLDNVGGIYGKMDINAGNYVESGKGIANPFWVVFDNGDWLEIGWEKGDMAPCNDTTASYYYYYKKGAVQTGSCLGTTSGSDDTFQISDADEDDDWQLKLNGLTKATLSNMYDNVGLSMVGGESTDNDNSLDGGFVQYIQYYNPSTNGWSYWSSSAYTSNDDPPYDAYWGSPSYRTLNYEDT